MAQSRRISYRAVLKTGESSRRRSKYSVLETIVLKISIMKCMRDDALKPTDFHVLLALASEPLHGYALVRRIENESEGRVRLLPGNLYAVLRRLGDGGLVEETDAPPDASDRRRRYYRLSDAGREALGAESQRLERLLGSMRERGLVDGKGVAP